MPEDNIGAEDALRNAQSAEDAATSAQADPKSFSPEYVRDLRQEAARWRVEAQQYKQPWENITTDDQKVWQEMIRLTQQDPKAGAEYMKNIAQYLSGDQQQNTASAEQRPLSQQDIARMVDERVNQATQSQIVAQINQEAEALGYKPGSLDYVELLWVAEHETNTDLKAADKSIQDRRGAWVESAIERKRAEMNGWPTVTRGGSPPAERPKEIKTWEDAKAAMNARLDKLGQF